MFEQALELWDRVEDPESVAGPRAGVLEQAAAAANNAGETERALALIEASLQETGGDEPTLQANRLVLKGTLHRTHLRLLRAWMLLWDGDLES